MKERAGTGNDRHTRRDGTARRDPALGINVDRVGSKRITDENHAVDTVNRGTDVEE